MDFIIITMMKPIKNHKLTHSNYYQNTDYVSNSMLNHLTGKSPEYFRFMMDNFETELVVMGVKLALTQYALPIDPDEVECFDEFHDRFGKYITKAQQA